MDYFYTTTENEPIYYNPSLEEHSSNLDLLCDISQYCCINNMDEYVKFIESKLKKDNTNKNSKDKE